MSSSVPEFSLEARKYLEEAKKILAPDPPPEGQPQPRARVDPDLPRAQALATLGLAYAVLAVRQYLPRLERP